MRLADIRHDQQVRFMDGNDLIEGRVHGFDRNLAIIVRDQPRGKWLVAIAELTRTDA